MRVLYKNPIVFHGLYEIIIFSHQKVEVFKIKKMGMNEFYIERQKTCRNKKSFINNPIDYVGTYLFGECVELFIILR